MNNEHFRQAMGKGSLLTMPCREKVRDSEELYNKSLSGDKDAFEELKAVAGNGDAQAQYILSCVYEDSACPFSSIELSMYWLKKSAENGCDRAKEVLSELSDNDKARYAVSEESASTDSGNESDKAIPYGIWTTSGRIDRTTFGVYIIILYFVSAIIFYFACFILNPNVMSIESAGVMRLLLRLVLCYPFLTLTAKRAHDCSYPGWIALVPFAALFLLFKKGVQGDNKYGPANK